MQAIQSIFFLVFTFFVSITLGAQTQNRDVSDFKYISVQSGIDLEITQSNNQSVTVIANKDVIDRILTEVEGNKLKIYIENSWKQKWRNNGPMTVKVSTDHLERLTASGGSDVESIGVWKSDNFRIQSSGGSDIELEIDVDELEVQCSGGSDIDIAGRADDLEIESSGGSDFNGRKLKTKKANVRSSGGSDVYVHVTEKLVARASGASDIYYSGDPKYRDVDTSSSSDVRKY